MTISGILTGVILRPGKPNRTLVVVSQRPGGEDVTCTLDMEAKKLTVSRTWVEAEDLLKWLMTPGREVRVTLTNDSGIGDLFSRAEFEEAT